MSVPDINARPPQVIRDRYKRIQRLTPAELCDSRQIIDFSRDDEPLRRELTSSSKSNGAKSPPAFDASISKHDLGPVDAHSAVEVTVLPGLIYYPSFLSPDTQFDLLEKLFHRDLSNPEHKTNVHMHYDVDYSPTNQEDSSSSFFDVSASNTTFQPKDPNSHSAISVQQFLNKKLRWMTLGGQYDWTQKVYPDGQPPGFPPDIKALIENSFPLRAEAAIVNLYSPGDTLSLHRDVSEYCNQPLLSMSIGSDGIFVVGFESDSSEGAEVVAIRLRSGDAILMSGPSRYAWHGVPKVVPYTCPTWLEEWPGGSRDPEARFAKWNGWMKGKRININVRQMFE